MEALKAYTTLFNSKSLSLSQKKNQKKHHIFHTTLKTLITVNIDVKIKTNTLNEAPVTCARAPVHNRYELVTDQWMAGTQPQRVTISVYY